MGPFESQIWPSQSSAPGAASSEPVDSTATRRPALTGNSSYPALIAVPMSPAERAWPAGKTSAPAATSHPAARTPCPGPGNSLTVMTPDAEVVSSIFTTLTVPGGTGAPVVTQAHVPGCKATRPLASPAATAPTSCSSQVSEPEPMA